MRWYKRMEKTETGKGKGNVEKGYALMRIVREYVTKKVLREQAIWQRTFQAERKASTKASRQECAWCIQGTARRLVVWLEWHKQERKF